VPATEMFQGAMAIPVGATTTQTSPDFQSQLSRGIKVFLVTTAIGTGSITLSIQAKDPASGTYTTLLAGAAVTTNTSNMYTVFPGAPVAANVSANDGLPRVFRIQVVANNANAATYSVGFSTLA
jgi:hypothetical protein